jgi:hypothetical protein
VEAGAIGQLFLGQVERLARAACLESQCRQVRILLRGGQRRPARGISNNSIITLIVCGACRLPIIARILALRSIKSGRSMDVEEKWRRALARIEAADAEVRAVARATAGGTAEEEEALQEVYDARLG